MFPFLLYLKAAVFIEFILIISTIVAVILCLLTRHYKQTGERLMLRWTRIVRLIVLFPIIAPVIFGPMIWFYAAHIEPNWIKVQEIVIHDDSFPRHLNNVKIALITDLHIERFGSREKKLIKIMNKIAPDVILMAGDYINSSDQWDTSMEVVGQLKAKKGIYAILGNTDYIFAPEHIAVKKLENKGVVVLKKGSVKLDFQELGSFWLVGISDRDAQNAKYGSSEIIDAAFKDIPDADPKILMIHDPQHAVTKEIAAKRPQIILSGDTHGGQVGIPFLRKFSDYADRGEYMSGMYNVNGIPLYVNRGIGMKTMYLRFLCRPEITIIKLVKP
jgi:predicted MPP superfamily phosphohydrolase